jgi:hypothetical protein
MRTKAMKKMEEAGWIFASNGKAFVGVKFLVLQRYNARAVFGF